MLCLNLLRSLPGAIVFFLSLCLLHACGKKEHGVVAPAVQTGPRTEAGGERLVFAQAEQAAFFGVERIGQQGVAAVYTAPAQIVAVVADRRMVLFSNPELSVHYTELLHHQSNIQQKQTIVAQKEALIAQKEAIIKQKQVEIERFEDLLAHGAATGKELSDAKIDKLVAESDKNLALSEKTTAESELIAEQSLLIEHQSKLAMAGLNPDALFRAGRGKTWLIAEIPENQLSQIKVGDACTVAFTAFPEQTFRGKIEAVAETVDNLTRMVKLRIDVPNPDNRLKVGMFANVSLPVSAQNNLTIPKQALLTVQGKHYAFVRKDPATFERRLLQVGQQIGDRIVVFSGLKADEEVVVQGAIQLKGLSFGY